jgi:hypothetical protein
MTNSAYIYNTTFLNKPTKPPNSLNNTHSFQ